MSEDLITFEVADIICQMENVCYSEGIGPDNTELMESIFNRYPELKEKYSYLVRTKL